MMHFQLMPKFQSQAMIKPEGKSTVMCSKILKDFLFKKFNNYLLKIKVKLKIIYE